MCRTGLFVAFWILHGTLYRYQVFFSVASSQVFKNRNIILLARVEWDVVIVCPQYRYNKNLFIAVVERVSFPSQNSCYGSLLESVGTPLDL